MPVYFGFSDETGNYEKERNDKFLKVHPYYIRALLLMNGEEYSFLEQEFKSLKTSFGLPINKEIKWAYIWPLRKAQRNKEEILPHKDYYFLKDYDYHKLLDYMDAALALLDRINYSKIYLTITDNKVAGNKFELKDCFKMHITSVLERIQMTLQNNPNNLAVIFFDPLEDKNKNNMLRNVYYYIREKGSFVQSFPNIKDSLNLEYSHQSVGIQLADYICGFTYGYIKGYDKSIEIFKKHIFNRIHRNSNSKCLAGYGIMEIPSDSVTRKNIINKFNVA